MSDILITDLTDIEQTLKNTFQQVFQLTQYTSGTSSIVLAAGNSERVGGALYHIANGDFTVTDPGVADGVAYVYLTALTATTGDAYLSAQVPTFDSNSGGWYFDGDKAIIRLVKNGAVFDRKERLSDVPSMTFEGDLGVVYDAYIGRDLDVVDDATIGDNLTVGGNTVTAGDTKTATLTFASSSTKQIDILSTSTTMTRGSSSVATATATGITKSNVLRVTAWIQGLKGDDTNDSNYYTELTEFDVHVSVSANTVTLTPEPLGEWASSGSGAYTISIEIMYYT
jgi:hypothetical protein